jgi:serine/threonine protein kinase
MVKVHAETARARDHTLIDLQLPPHIRTVFRSTDVNQKELIAKHVDRESAEITILEYLCAIQPQSLHVVHLIDTVPTNTGNWAIFQRMHALQDFFWMSYDNPQHYCRLAQLVLHLIAALAYLHDRGVAHIDVRLQYGCPRGIRGPYR